MLSDRSCKQRALLIYRDWEKNHPTVQGMQRSVDANAEHPWRSQLPQHCRIWPSQFLSTCKLQKIYDLVLSECLARTEVPRQTIDLSNVIASSNMVSVETMKCQHRFDKVLEYTGNRSLSAELLRVKVMQVHKMTDQWVSFQRAFWQEAITPGPSKEARPSKERSKAQKEGVLR